MRLIQDIVNASMDTGAQAVNMNVLAVPTTPASVMVSVILPLVTAHAMPGCTKARTVGLARRGGLAKTALSG